MVKKTITLFICTLILLSCDVAKQASGIVNMTQCKYDYKSIEQISLAGVNLQNVSNISSLNPISAANLLAAFSSSSGSLPLNFTLNLNVTNNNKQTASFSGLAYILEIDGHEMTQGALNQAFSVNGGSSSVLPISMSFDLKKVLSGQSMDSVKNLAFNFAGIGSGKSDVTLRVKPTFKVGSQVINSPQYIPINFTLNAQK